MPDEGARARPRIVSFAIFPFQGPCCTRRPPILDSCFPVQGCDGIEPGAGTRGRTQALLNHGFLFLLQLQRLPKSFLPDLLGLPCDRVIELLLPQLLHLQLFVRHWFIVDGLVLEAAATAVSAPDTGDIPEGERSDRR